MYRKELSSNSVYNGKKGGNNHGKGRHQSVSVVTHAAGCPAASAVSEGGTNKPCMCATRIGAQQRRLASAASRLRTSVDERKLRRLIEGRMRSLDLSGNHLQQLRASVDASWSSFSTAWETRRARGSGATSVRECSGEAEQARRPTADDFVMPSCSHHASSHGNKHISAADTGLAVEQREASPRCVECAALAAAHAAAASILRNDDGTLGLLEADDVWASSSLGALPVDTLNKALGFLAPQDLLSLAQVSMGAREAADGDFVWREAWSARFGAIWESGMCRGAAKRWHLHGWDPKSSSVPQVSSVRMGGGKCG